MLDTNIQKVKLQLSHCSCVSTRYSDDAPGQFKENVIYKGMLGRFELDVLFDR